MSSSSSPSRVGLLGDDAAAALSDLDWRLVRWAAQLKSDLPERPKQTGFRVFCILTYKPLPPPTDAPSPSALSSPHPFDQHLLVDGTEGQLAYMLGTNTEPCFIGSGICAERTAILQMRLKRYSSIEKLYITADSDSIITPGLLCREMLCEFLEPDTQIVLASTNPARAHGFDVQVATLAELYPHPHLYLNVPGSTVKEYAKHFHSSCLKFSQEFASHPDWVRLYEQAVATTAKDLRPSLHPLQYAAGVIYSDGTSQCVATTKLLEFGWTIDAVVKLVPFLEEKRAKGVEPTLILMVDQFGNLHAPSAPARSHLAEYSYDPILVFHSKQGQLLQCRVRELALDVPDAIENVLPTTVTFSAASAH